MLGGHGIACPVAAVLIAEVELAVEVALQIPLVVVIIFNILFLHHALADVHIQRLPGQHQAEELVAGRPHRADGGDLVVIVKQGHETGNAALHLDFEQHLRRRKAPLGPAGGEVVHHHGGDALALRVVQVLFVTGEHIGLVGHGRGFRCGLRSGRGFIAAGLPAASGISAAGREQARRKGQGQNDTDKTFHV